MADSDAKKDAEYEAAFKEEMVKESKKTAAKKPADAAPVVPPIPAAPAAPESAKFIVLEAKSVLWRGGLTMLRKGKILSETHYGKDGIEHLVKQGVKLEAVK